MCGHFQGNLISWDNHKWTQEQYVDESSLVILCIVLLCVTVCLSFRVHVYEWKFLYERQGTVIAQTTFLLLNCLRLFYLFMIKKKGKIRYLETVC